MVGKSTDGSLYMTKIIKSRNRAIKIRNLCFLLVSIILLTTGCGGEYPKADSLVVTVDDSKVYMNEMMYHIMLEKLQGELYASFLGDEGKDYWDMKAENGKTMREVSKEQALENGIKYEMFYQRALKDNYNLTEEEKQSGLEKVENIIKNVPAEQLSEYGLSKEKLVEIQDKITIATIYYNNYVDSIVDKDAIRASIDADKYEQFDIEYIYATKEQKDKITELIDEVNIETDFKELVTDTELKSGKLTFLKGENTFNEEDNLEDIITSMEAGMVSELVETVKGYYIIKLKDNTSKSEYEKAVEEAINEAVSLAFDKEYKELKAEHNIKINTKIWKQVEIGN